MPGQPGNAVSGSGVPAGVGAAVGPEVDVGLGGDAVGDSGRAVLIGRDAGTLAGTAEAAWLAPGLAIAAWLAAGAIGSCSPPRAATKVMAMAAHATVNSADATTAGVSARGRASRVEPSTPLLRRCRDAPRCVADR